MFKKLIGILVAVQIFSPLAFGKKYFPSQVVEVEEEFLDSLTDSQRAYLEKKLDQNFFDTDSSDVTEYEFFDLESMEDVAAASVRTSVPDGELKLQ